MGLWGNGRTALHPNVAGFSCWPPERERCREVVQEVQARLWRSSGKEGMDSNLEGFLLNDDNFVYLVMHLIQLICTSGWWSSALLTEVVISGANPHIGLSNRARTAWPTSTGWGWPPTSWGRWWRSGKRWSRPTATSRPLMVTLWGRETLKSRWINIHMMH